MKIFITGCAASGTTLLRRLMNAFEGQRVCNDKEITLDEFIRSDYTVGKRDHYTIMCKAVDKATQDKQILQILNNDIKLVYIYRNKADVLKSRGGFVKPDRYDAVRADAKRYSKLIDFTVSYDELLLAPDRIQIQMAAALGLEIKHMWSDYPDWVDWQETGPWTERANYTHRKIGAAY
jgi:hypothetical protein